MKRFAYFTLMLMVVAGLTACKQNSEQNNLSEAQKCLDNVPESDPTQAESCMATIENYSDPQADILKCSITITYGGLTEDKIVAAYNIFADNSQTNQAASFMAALSLSDPTNSANPDYTLAQQANAYCLASGDLGLIYISDMILAGTYLNQTIQSLTSSGININDPSSVNTAVNTLLGDCAGTTPSATCQQNLAGLGSAASSLAGAYCNTSGADQSVCGQVNSAVSSAGSSSTAVGQALLCYMNKKTYDPTTNACQ